MTAFPPDYRIPILGADRYSWAYREIPIDHHDPRHDEQLVRLESFGVNYESYHARIDGGNPPYYGPVPGSRKDMWLRPSLASKLAEVNRLLRPHDRELLILDGYRPIACQRGLWDFYYEQGRKTLGSSDHDVLREYAEKFVADPSAFSEDDPTSWPAHTSGGAIDVTLRWLSSGEVVDMGSNYEEITETSHCDYFERLLDLGDVVPDDLRLMNRRLLHWAMHQHGIFNHPCVFWHHDWGNQLYVRTWMDLFADPPEAAWYSYIGPPPE